MNKIQLLNEVYDEEVKRLLGYSKNFSMKEAKENYKELWEDSRIRIQLLEEIIYIINEKEGKTNFYGQFEYKEVIKISFSEEQILRMYPNTKYYVRNSNGGLLAGTIELKDAKEYAEKYKKEYLHDSLNNHLGVYVYDKNGKNVYVAKGREVESEDTEEFE